MYAAVASGSTSTTGGCVIGITKPLTRLFPVSGDDPAFISFYFGYDNEDSTFKRTKEQPDQTAVVSFRSGVLRIEAGLSIVSVACSTVKSTLASALLDMRGVVKFVRHRPADYALAETSASLFLRIFAK